jgi:hypothetical protein
MRKHIYLFLAVVGLIVPYYFLISFVVANGLDGRLFVKQLFGTPISAFFAADLFLSCIVFVLYFRQETRRHSIEHAWVCLAALFIVGLSCALPLFLYLREPCLLEEHADLN